MLSACLVMSLVFAQAAVAQAGGPVGNTIVCPEESVQNAAGTTCTNLDTGQQVEPISSNIVNPPTNQTNPCPEFSSLQADGTCSELDPAIAGIQATGPNGSDCPQGLNPADVSGTGNLSCVTDAQLADFLAQGGADITSAQYADDDVADDDAVGLPNTGGPALLPIAAGLGLAGIGGLLLRRRLS